MSSLQSLFEKEMNGVETIENEKWYYTFKVDSSEASFHVLDIFIHPKYRNSDSIVEIFDHIENHAKEIACKYIVGKIHVGLPNPDKILTLHFKRGMKILKIENPFIYTFKEVIYG